MKKFLLIALMTLTFSTLLVGQGLRLKTYIEKTSASPKLGTSIGYVFGDQIELGGFFQKSTIEFEPETGRPLNVENEFYGAYFAYPLVRANSASVKFNVRTGVSNGTNFVITPSIMANYRPLKFVSLGAGVGTRSFNPTYMASISIWLNGK